MNARAIDAASHEIAIVGARTRLPREERRGDDAVEHKNRAGTRPSETLFRGTYRHEGLDSSTTIRSSAAVSSECCCAEAEADCGMVARPLPLLFGLALLLLMVVRLSVCQMRVRVVVVVFVAAAFGCGSSWVFC
jgi:hypothetical protein